MMQLIRQLEATRDETLKYFALSDSELSRSYGPGKWPVRFILLHLSDSETVLFDRIRRILSEPRQVIWAYDQDALGQGSRLRAGTARDLPAGVPVGAGCDHLLRGPLL